jgi:3-hydroxyacyl-CoA dehydrogenase
MTSTVRLDKRGHVGLIITNHPPVNALSHAVRAGVMDAVTRAIADPEVGALVLVCEGNCFFSGADIRELGQPMQTPLLGEVIRAIDQCPKPVIAAIHGSALGGGFELALACHFRIATASAKVGLPEVKLGILPGCGGTQRLPRLVGVEAALKLIVEGNPISAAQALAMGAIDHIVEGELQEAALAFAERVISEAPALRRVSAMTVTPDDPLVFENFAKGIARKQRGFLAPFACIEAVRAACDLPFEDGLQREYALAIELLHTSQSKAQRHVFFAERALRRTPGMATDMSQREVKAMAVIGTGTMACGIAICFLNAEMAVHMLGKTADSLTRGLHAVRKHYAGAVARGSLSQQQMDQRLALLHTTLSYGDLGDADLVIEAVSEDMALKQAVFRALDQACKPGAILATNTSYLSIDALADVTSRAQDVMGMHFFNPANVMKLLENVRGAKTAPEVLATVMQLSKRIGKTAVLVGMCDGFVGNRMLAKRSREGFFMLEEGALPWQIDKVLFDFGFPMGPYAMGDLAGLDVAWAARKARMQRLAPREQACDILDKLCLQGRFGQKTGAGYYRYDDKRNATPDPLVESLILRHSHERGITRRVIDDQEIRERCLYAMINEGAKILEEGVATRAVEIDMTWIHGFGFPVYRGGPLFYADQIGLATVRQKMLEYRDRHGAAYWTPAPLLEQLAAQGKSFYSE